MRSSLFILLFLLSNQVFAATPFTGKIVDVYVGEIDPHTLGDVCVVMVETNTTSIGLVMEETCMESIDESLLGRTVEISSAALSKIKDQEAIRVLKRFDASFFYLNLAGSLTLVPEPVCQQHHITLAVAHACLKEFADRTIGQGEEENTIIVSQDPSAFLAAKKLVAHRVDSTRLLAVLDQAEFVGVVNLHEDEDMFFYFAINLSAGKEFVEVYQDNIAELYSFWPAGVDPLDFALGVERVIGWHYDIFEEAKSESER